MGDALLRRPSSSEVVDISSANHDVAAKSVLGIYCNAAGTLIATLRGDSASFPYEVVLGQVLYGDFKQITKTGTDLTSAQMLLLINSPDGSS